MKKRRATHTDVVEVQLQVRRSSRNATVPKRFQYSPEAAGVQRPAQKRRRTTIHFNQNKKDVGNSDEEASSVANGGLSSYELERLENIRQNKVFLSSINLSQATEELRQLNRPKPSPRRLVRTKAAVKETLPPRKSLRLQHKEAAVKETLPPRISLRLQHKEPETLPSDIGALLVTPRKPPGPLPLEPVNMEEGSKLPPQLLELWSEGSTVEGKTWLDLNEYSSALKRMRATEGRVETERVSSAAFHPCASSLLMATGDTLGKVGLWKSGGGWGDGGALLFEPHSGPVGCMAFCRAQPTQLLSLSYDGSLRCMDVEKAVFHDVYGSNVGLRTFDFMSLDCFTLVVGNRLGDVAIVDRRTPGNTHESLHSLDPNTLRCVSVHPSLKHYFAVAESKVVNIYDCRYLKSTHSLAVSQLHGHSSSITSAYFSPCTGNRVLTTCMDNRIRIYDTAARTTTSPLVASIRHNMQTCLTKLSAVWDPKREDCFVVGSVCQSRMALAFHESGELQHSFIDREDLLEVLSAIAIHPTRNAFLGCAASGRLHVFSD